MQDFESTKRDLLAELHSRGLEVAPGALKPLRAIDFQRLVAIHDHEEHFIREQFLQSLERAHRARIHRGGGPSKVIGADIKTAMLLLGGAVEAAADAVVSPTSRTIVRDICPYC